MAPPRLFPSLLAVLLGYAGQGFVNCRFSGAIHSRCFWSKYLQQPRCQLFAVRDPWAVLELSPGASRDEVKKAFREKIRKAHPDAGGTAQEFKEVREAYQTALSEAGTKSSGAGPKGTTRGWSINDFYKWRRDQVKQQRVEWEKDAQAAGGRHWWTSAEQRSEQKQQAQSMDEEPPPREPRGTAERRTARGQRATERGRKRSGRGGSRFEDDSVREWNDFLSKRSEPTPPDTDTSAQRAQRRSAKIRDPVVTHRSIATLQGDVRVPVFRSKTGRCYYVSPLTNRDVTVPL